MPARTEETWVEDYLGHKIAVTASRIDTESNWTLAVDVTLSDGCILPTAQDHGHSYAMLDEAEVAGFDIAKGLINSQS